MLPGAADATKLATSNPEIQGNYYTRQVRTPKCKHCLGNIHIYIYIYIHIYIYIYSYIPQTVLALRGSYFVSIVIPLEVRIAGRRP